MLRQAAASLLSFYRLFLFLGTRSTTKMITAAAIARAMISPVKRKPFSSRSSIRVLPVESGVVVISGFIMEDDSGILLVLGACVLAGDVVSGLSIVVMGAVASVTVGAVASVTAGAVVWAQTAVVSEKRSARRTKNESKRNPLSFDMTTDPFGV